MEFQRGWRWGRSNREVMSTGVRKEATGHSKEREGGMG